MPASGLSLGKSGLGRGGCFTMVRGDLADWAAIDALFADDHFEAATAVSQVSLTDGAGAFSSSE